MELGKAAISRDSKEVHKLDIMRIGSYHRHEFGVIVAKDYASGHGEIRSSLLRTISATLSTLGDLQLLPLEIIYEICSLLDIRSLFNFRQVNRRAQQIVRQTRDYELAITHAIEAVWVTLNTNIAYWFTISDLFKVLCTRDCHICGSFGGFIFLPSIMRCCLQCVQNDRLPSISRVSVYPRRKCLSSLYSLAPTVTSLDGRYANHRSKAPKGIQIIPTEILGTLSSGIGIVKVTATRSKGIYPLRYMATTALPFLDVESGVVQNGICCIGCRISIWAGPRKAQLPNLVDKLYSYDEFMEHFWECQDAQMVMEFKQSRD